jgi:hypothetical protein
VNGSPAGLVEPGRHRRAGTILVGNGVNFMPGILAPDPGGSATSKASVAVPEQPMLRVW